MDITRLDWDSEFFGYEIGQIIATGSEIPSENLLRLSGFKLIYIISQNKLRCPFIELMDEKVYLNCEIKKKVLYANNNILQFDPAIHSDKELIDLNLKSGIYSRFNLDKNFSNFEFEKLYNKWITNSMQDNENSEILVKIVNHKIVGFIALKDKNKSIDIQLLAVDPLNRGMGIGSLLIDESKKYTITKGYKSITVTTQLNNTPAMNLYKRNNFSITNINNIYHYWNL